MKSIYAVLILILLCLPVFTPAKAAQKDAAYVAIVSTRTIERDQVIGPDDVKAVTLSKYDPRTEPNIKNVIGKSLKRTVGKNTAIKSDYLKVGPMVRKGDDIMIVAQRGGLKVTVNGVAKESADIGELIRIENLSSGSIVTGKLIDRSTALINF